MVWIGVIIIPLGLWGSVVCCQPELTEVRVTGSPITGSPGLSTMAQDELHLDSCEERRPGNGRGGILFPRSEAQRPKEDCQLG